MALFVVAASAGCSSQQDEGEDFGNTEQASLLSKCGELKPGNIGNPTGVVNKKSLVFSCDMEFSLRVQADGNLVLYKGTRMLEGGQALWATNTVSSGADHLNMQKDGNLVLYTARNQVVWATGTDGHPGARFAMQNDGNMVIYHEGKAIWASNTVWVPPPPPPPVGLGFLADIAAANLGNGPCDTNSTGGQGYYGSCGEAWCADFVRWVWATGGLDVSELNASAGNFFVYGERHGTLHADPRVGDAIVFNYQGGGYADHMGMVTKVNGDGTIEAISGNFSHKVTLHAPAFPGVVGSRPDAVGQTISGFISPAGR